MPAEIVENARVAIIHNAHKDRRRAERFADDLRARGSDVRVISTLTTGEGSDEAKRVVSEGAEVIVAAGGDGTVRSVVPALIDGSATLGLLPLGASNDLATELGIRTYADALETIIGATAQSWDVGHCTFRGEDGAEQTSVFCSTAGVGLVARALQMAQSRPGEVLKTMLGNGAWPPLLTASACRTRPERCRIGFDDVSVEQSLMLLELSKLKSAGGISLTPDARGDSGILHTWVVGSPRTWHFAGILYDALSGSLRHLRGEHVDYISHDPAQNRHRLARVTRVSVESEVPLPVHLNGDYVGTTPVRFALSAHALRVLAPAPLFAEHVRVVRGERVPADAQLQLTGTARTRAALD